MAKDPLALSEVLTGPSSEAEYETIYASVAATARGRAFLAEFAGRGRHADTRAIVEALARVEAAVGGRPAVPVAAAARDDFCEIAAALQRIEAEIDAAAASAPDTAAAVERIQDIAFILHERTVEATLCDGLDAAVRDIAEACARSSELAALMAKARDLLGALSRRVGDLVAGAGRQDTAAVSEGTFDPSSSAPLFQMDAGQAEDFARAVAEVVASLPAPARAAAPAIESIPPGAPTERHDIGTSVASERPADRVAAREALPGPTVSMDAGQIMRPFQEVPPGRPPSIEALLPRMEFEGGGAEVSASGRPSLHGNDPLSAADDFARLPVAAGRARPSSQLLPSLTGPEENPADLFGPSPVVAPPQRAVPHPAGNDPLAAVRALSDEELIALFS